MKHLTITIITFLLISFDAIASYDSKNKIEIGDLTYCFDYDKLEAQVVDCSNRVQSISIPSSVSHVLSYSVVEIGDSAFYGRSSLTSVDIPSSVTKISSYAFGGCSSLTTIYIPNSVTYIEDAVFFGCSKLKNLILEDGDKDLFLGRIDNLRSLENIYIGRSCSYKFSGLNAIESVTIGSGASSIGGYFKECPYLKKIIIADSDQELFLNSMSFPGSPVEEIYLGRNVSFGNHSPFSNIKTLTSAVVGNQVTVLNDVFADCTSLRSVKFEDGVDILYAEASEIFRECPIETLYLGRNIITGTFPFGRLDTPFSVTVGNLVTTIGEYVFFGCTGLKSFSCSDSVKEIGEYSFSDCTGLTSINLGNSVEYIGEGAFSDCSSLTSIEIPNSVEFIGERVFKNCSSIEYVKLPDQCTEIPNEMFAMCTSLKDFVIPDGIQSIGKSAFLGCSKAFTNICFPSSLYKIDDKAFEESLTHDQGDDYLEVFLPPSVKILGNGAFRGCSGIKKVIIAGDDVTIGSEAFLDCRALNTAIIGDTSLFPESPSIIIGEKAFVRCNNLSDLQLSYCVKSIGKLAFLLTDNSVLKEVYIPSSITYIGESAFSDRGGLHDIYYPSNTPCKASEDAFGSVMFGNNDMYLHIPIGSRVSTWSANPSGPWAHFKNYREEDYPVEAIKIKSSQNVILSGDSLHLETIIYPSGANNGNILWSSDNDEVAIVGADGTVIGLSTGVANITVSSGEVAATRQVTVNPVKVSAVILSSNDITLQIGQSDRLTATIEPNGAFDKNIKWVSDDESVAIVESDGTVTGVSAGVATITATCGEVWAACKVTVNPVTASGITINVMDLTLSVGDSYLLTATVEPENATDKTVVWASDDESVAIVESDGTVTGVSAGVATITATCGEVWAACKVTVNPVTASGITINVMDLTLSVGDSYLLTATVEPENATDKTVVWASDDESVAIVESDGTVTGVSPGIATITAACGEVSATCKVIVNPILIESISLSPESWMGKEGDSFKIEAEVFPENATDRTLSWSSSDDSIVSVDSDGYVKAIAPGNAIITAKANDGSEVGAICSVTVNSILVESIRLTPEHLNGEEGNFYKIEATVLPENATEKTLIWSSSDESVAAINSEGVVYILKEGECVITATASDGSGVTAECIVTGVAGIDSIFSDNGNFDIYSVNGTLIRKDCDYDHLKTLVPDVYIIRHGNLTKKLIIH